jgi:AcrR family transcriptional regulator
MFDIRHRMVSTGPMARRAVETDKPARLDAAAWIAAAFDAVADGGIDAVRVEPLAKALRITKGSFYWHFADRRALIDAMLVAWATGRIAAIRAQAALRGDPAAALRDLADLYTRNANVRGLAIELAIRALARTDAAAAKAARSVDRERLKHVGELFAALGWDGGAAQARAVAFYSYLFGQSLLDPQAVPPAARAGAIEALLAKPR